MVPTGKQKQEEQEALERLRAELKSTQGELEALKEKQRQRQRQVGTEEKCQDPESWTTRETQEAQYPTGLKFWLVSRSWESEPEWYCPGCGK